MNLWVSLTSSLKLLMPINPVKTLVSKWTIVTPTTLMDLVLPTVIVMVCNTVPNGDTAKVTLLTENNVILKFPTVTFIMPSNKEPPGLNGQIMMVGTSITENSPQCLPVKISK